ncbi:trimethylamine methyltransferase family protein [bacterium]|nr:trimethylamine methyltransferase family protein [bacterium]
MTTPLFTDDQFALLADQVRRTLREIGYHVGHPRLHEMALAAGCRESAQGRVLFADEQIDDLKQRLQEQYPPAATQPALIHPRHELRVGLGNITPKLFNYAANRVEGGTRGNLAWLMKFAHAAPCISGITLPLSRVDVPPAIEQLDSVLLMARLTDKRLGGVDTTYPEAIPFLYEAGAILGHDPVAFLGVCNCVNPPLRLEHRTCETMLRRAQYHATSMITPMPCLGGSGPVDTWGSIVLGTAETVGGLILSMILDPEAPLKGWIASTAMDMRACHITSSSPQTVQVDAGIVQLMDRHFGGGAFVGGRTYVSAKRPGLQAVFEKLLKGIGYAQFVDDHALSYPGHGTLDNGSVHCPEQFLLDFEILEGFEHLWQRPVATDGDDVVERLRRGILDQGGNFLADDHTLTRYRDEAWDPRYFQRAIDTKTEQQVLDQAHADVEGYVAAYEPAPHPPEVLRALEDVLGRARAELL